MIARENCIRALFQLTGAAIPAENGGPPSSKPSQIGKFSQER